MKECRHTSGIKRVITFSIFTYTYLRAKFLYSSCVFYFNGNQNELTNLRSQFYVKNYISLCHRYSFFSLLCAKHDVSWK